MPKSFLNIPGYPIGLRNNNPGNIRPGDNWQGMIGTNGGFVTFKDLSWGLRAMGIDLLTKINNGYNTIEKIITRWAPPSENDTEAYIGAYLGSVVAYTGFARNKVIEPTRANLLKLMRAIIKVELGASYAALITDADINEGIAMIDSGIPTAAAVGGFTIAAGLLAVSIYLLFTMPKASRPR